MSRDQWLAEMANSYDKVGVRIANVADDLLGQFMSEFAKADSNHDGAVSLRPPHGQASLNC